MGGIAATPHPALQGAPPAVWRDALPRGAVELRVLIPPAVRHLPRRLAAEPKRLGKWRMGGDSNPRYLAVNTLSRRAQSTTLPPILCARLRSSRAGSVRLFGRCARGKRRKCSVRSAQYRLALARQVWNGDGVRSSTQRGYM